MLCTYEKRIEMTDLGSISTILSSVKAATDIAKLIKDADLSLEKAEMKLQVAELISSLADAKIAVAEVNDIIKEKDDRIKELEHAFAFKSKIARYMDAYYEPNEEGIPSGAPYCSNCWEASNRAIHLYYLHPHQICTHCKTKYANYRVPMNPENEIKKKAEQPHSRRSPMLFGSGLESVLSI